MGTVNLPPAIQQEIENVPMLSEVAVKLMSLTADEDHDLTEVVRIIESDVYLAANVLKLANSAAFSRGHQIETVRRGVMHIGEALVVSLALAMSTGALFHQPLVGYARPEGALWAFCLQEAIAAREISRYARPGVRSDLAYTSGLLFNIGMAILSSHLEKHQEDLEAAVADGPEQDFISIEEALTGTNRDRVGAMIARRWKLPEPIVTALEYGHFPHEAPPEYRPLVYSVHMGDLLARSIGFGAGLDSLSYTLKPGHERYLPIQRAELEKVFLDVVEEFTKIESFILAE